ncbi:MAG: hypothetical protein WAW17_31780, partial [Rhodococcus sp. (in: high G+C Gram-positive bacteria)]|uniref:GIY-YIG nuclease family protein n=1 Tax=Rhodococcus sp. TaxID=1831 RepID=UPI003BAFBFBE
MTAGHGGSSTLRRTLAGLLLESEGYRTRRTDRVVLTDTDEIRLTSCMETHLRLSWCEHTTPREVELAIIEKLKPPLNVDHASGPLRDAVKAARDCYYASAPNHCLVLSTTDPLRSGVDIIRSAGSAHRRRSAQGHA